MTDPELRATLTGVFRDVFDDESIVIFDGMTAKDIEDWDSLTHVNLIAAAEKAFKVRFSTKDIQSLSNVGAFVALIRRRLPG